MWAAPHVFRQIITRSISWIRSRGQAEQEAAHGITGLSLSATVSAKSYRSGHSFMNPTPTIFGRIQTIRFIFIRSRKHLLPLARLGRKHNSPSELGGFRWLKRSPKLVA